MRSMDKWGVFTVLQLTKLTYISRILCLNFQKTMVDFFKQLHLDLRTCLFTTSLISVLIILWRIVLKHIKEWGNLLIEGTLYILSRTINHSLAATFTLNRYCRIQLGNERLKNLHVPSSTDISLPIDQIFVKLTLRGNLPNDGDLSNWNLLTIGNRIKIMGDPGSGKSSLIKRTFRDQCQSGRSKPRSTKLPVLIELKNIQLPEKKDIPDHGKWLYRYIKGEVAKVRAYKMAECFDIYSETKGILLLLDGLDEVSSTNYAIIEKAINELSIHLGELSENNSIVLTMRTQFYQQVQASYLSNFPHTTFLKPFTPADIYEFLSRWHFKKEAETHISRIYNDLTDRPTLREMCSNPLILSMYVAEDQASNENISPESRTEFYKRVTEELIIKRRQKQKTQTASSHTVLKDQRERILGRIAYNHIINIDQPRNSLQWSDAIAVIKATLKCDNVTAETVFNELSRETGLITEERVHETFRFIHLTFCEFLAAFEAVQGIENGWEQLIMAQQKFLTGSLEDRSRLIEVIPFTAGLLPRVRKSQALTDVAEFDDYNLMSRCYLETKLYEHPGWNDFINKASEKFLSFSEEQLDEHWLQDLHLFNVVVRDAEVNSRYKPNIANIDLSDFYKDLLKNRDNGLEKILSAYASQDAAAAFRLCEICKFSLIDDFPKIVIDNCDQIPFLGLVMDKIVQDNPESPKWAALVTESALRKRVVAHLLEERSPNMQIDQRINAGNNYRRWYDRLGVRKTFYKQCMTLSSRYPAEKESLPALDLFMKLRSPHETTLNYLIFSIGYLCVSAFIIIYTTQHSTELINEVHKSNPRLTQESGRRILRQLSYMTALLPIPLLLLVRIYRTRFYRAAMNLSPHVQDSYLRLLKRVFRFRSRSNIILSGLLSLQSDQPGNSTRAS